MIFIVAMFMYLSNFTLRLNGDLRGACITIYIKHIEEVSFYVANNQHYFLLRQKQLPYLYNCAGRG